MAHQGSNLLVLILDNATTALSGFQGTPNLGGTDLGHETTPLSIDDIVDACSVSLNETIDPWGRIPDAGRARGRTENSRVYA